MVIKKGIGQEPVPKERVDEDLEFSVWRQLNGEENRQRKDEAWKDGGRSNERSVRASRDDVERREVPVEGNQGGRGSWTGDEDTYGEKFAGLAGAR